MKPQAGTSNALDKEPVVSGSNDSDALPTAPASLATAHAPPEPVQPGNSTANPASPPKLPNPMHTPYRFEFSPSFLLALDALAASPAPTTLLAAGAAARAAHILPVLLLLLLS